MESHPLDVVVTRKQTPRLLIFCNFGAYSHSFVWNKLSRLELIKSFHFLCESFAADFELIRAVVERASPIFIVIDLILIVVVVLVVSAFPLIAN